MVVNVSWFKSHSDLGALLLPGVHGDGVGVSGLGGPQARASRAHLRDVTVAASLATRALPSRRVVAPPHRGHRRPRHHHREGEAPT